MLAAQPGRKLTQVAGQRFSPPYAVSPENAIDVEEDQYSVRCSRGLGHIIPSFVGCDRLAKTIPKPQPRKLQRTRRYPNTATERPISC